MYQKDIAVASPDFRFHKCINSETTGHKTRFSFTVRIFDPFAVAIEKEMHVKGTQDKKSCHY
jgi:hypothetical protein